jgi:hypothetical protein
VTYAEFLARKSARLEIPGRVVHAADIHPLLHPWQNELVRWAVLESQMSVPSLFEDVS